MEHGETSLVGLEMRKILNCYGVNCSEMAVKLFSIADVCECTCVHCTECTQKCIQETVYSPGWEDMGVVVELEEWTLVMVGLADNVGVALAGVVKVVIPDGRQIERDSIESMLMCKFLVSLSACLCADHFNLCQL